MKRKKILKKISITPKTIKSILNICLPLPIALLLGLNMSLGAVILQHYYYKNHFSQYLTVNQQEEESPEKQTERIKDEMFSDRGVTLPISWGNLGPELVKIGVIDKDKFMELFKSGPLSSEENNYESILSETHSEKIILTQENSRFVLNVLWALGLAQQSKVLTNMQNDYPEVSNLAATGGWSIGKDDPMVYYGKHSLIDLTDAQQDVVKNISENIYRPCCNNPTSFPDCNHGMAMLGLIEIMVSEGYSEKEIYDVALAVNSIWFPNNYITIARYMENEKDVAWKDVDSKEILGATFSSGSGNAEIFSKVEPLPNSGGGGSCGV